MNIGTNVTGCPNIRFTFSLKKQAPKRSDFFSAVRNFGDVFQMSLLRYPRNQAITKNPPQRVAEKS